jgi:hypothetical protein
MEYAPQASVQELLRRLGPGRDANSNGLVLLGDFFEDLEAELSLCRLWQWMEDREAKHDAVEKKLGGGEAGAPSAAAPTEGVEAVVSRLSRPGNEEIKMTVQDLAGVFCVCWVANGEGGYTLQHSIPLWLGQR